MATTVISMRLKPAEMQSLRRVARRWGRSPSEVSARLVEEALRAEEFAHLEFRDSAAGRQAFIKGTRLSVWMLISIAKQYHMDVARTAGHLHWVPERVQAGLNYYSAFPDEIDPVLEENDAVTVEQIARRLPGVEEFVGGAPSPSRAKRKNPAPRRRPTP